MQDKPRQTALEVLLRIERDAAYANLALDAALSGASMDGRGTAFCSALIYGVTERCVTLDWLLSRQLQKPLKQLRPPVLCALRMGAYQLWFMDSVPASAAVNTTVQLLKANGCAYAAGLANAVLRKSAGDRREEAGSKQEALMKSLPPDLSIRYSVPGWLAELWISAYGRDTAEAILAASFGGGDTYIRVNTLKTTRDGLISALGEEGVEALPSPALPHAAILSKGAVPQKTRAFAQGLYHVQGLASQYCVEALKPMPGERVLDMCAAPGGKSFTIAQEIYINDNDLSPLHRASSVTALELHPHRAELIRKGAERLGIDNIEVRVADASKLSPEECGLFDAVLCDAPCSGLGTLGKKPDIRRKEMPGLDNLPEIQYTLLMNAASLTHSGGRLIYSTCTLNPAENEGVCSRFLAENPLFIPDKQLTLFPHIHGCDGFFIAVFNKRQEA